MSAHTPGPWGAHQVPDRSLWNVYGGTDALPVATVASDTGSTRGPRGSVEVAANARLIAAAPELLSALLAIRAVAAQNDEGDVSWNVVDDCARIAIAKATQP